MAGRVDLIYALRLSQPQSTCTRLSLSQPRFNLKLQIEPPLGLRPGRALFDLVGSDRGSTWHVVVEATLSLLLRIEALFGSFNLLTTD